MPSGEELARLLGALRPGELPLWDWVRSRLTASIVWEIAALDYGVDVEGYRERIEDLRATRRPPAELGWDTREVLQLASYRPEPGRGHVARLFSCLVLVCVPDADSLAETLAGLVESALELGPEATDHAVSFLAWCRLHEPGTWRDDDEARPFLALALLLLSAAVPGRADPDVAEGLLRTFVAEVTAVWPPAQRWPDGTPSPLLRKTAGADGWRTWRRLIDRCPDGGGATLRKWFRICPE